MGVTLVRENSRPHTGVQAVQAINELGWELSSHMPHRSDLIPSDCQLFGPLKAFKRGKKFESNDEVKSVVTD